MHGKVIQKCTTSPVANNYRITALTIRAARRLSLLKNFFFNTFVSMTDLSKKKILAEAFLLWAILSLKKTHNRQNEMLLLHC